MSLPRVTERRLSSWSLCFHDSLMGFPRQWRVCFIASGTGNWIGERLEVKISCAPNMSSSPLWKDMLLSYRVSQYAKKLLGPEVKHQVFLVYISTPSAKDE